MVEVKWHSRAESEYRDALIDGYEEFGRQVSVELSKEVERCTRLLAQFPYIRFSCSRIGYVSQANSAFTCS